MLVIYLEYIENLLSFVTNVDVSTYSHATSDIIIVMDYMIYLFENSCIYLFSSSWYYVRIFSIMVWSTNKHGFTETFMSFTWP